jgi:hypothetical protein
MTLPALKTTQTYDSDVAQQVTRLLRLFDRRRLPASEAAELIRDYTTVLHGLSLDSISEAVMRFSRGQVDWASKTFAPTPAELYSAADEIDRARIAREQVNLRLEERRAPRLPAPMRRSMDELHARYGETWGLTVTGGKKPPAKHTDEEIQANLERIKGEEIPVSPDLIDLFTNQQRGV